MKGLEVIQITKLIGVIVLAVLMLRIIWKMKGIKEEDPQAYIKTELLLIEMWVAMIFVFRFFDSVIVALAL